MIKKPINCRDADLSRLDVTTTRLDVSTTRLNITTTPYNRYVVAQHLKHLKIRLTISPLIMLKHVNLKTPFLIAAIPLAYNLFNLFISTK